MILMTKKMILLLHPTALQISLRSKSKTKRSRTTKTNRTLAPKSPSLPYPKSTPTPLLANPPPSSLSQHDALLHVIQQIQSSTDRGVPVNDPSIFSSLLETLFHLDSPIHIVTLLHSLIPPPLLRSSAALSSKLLRLYAACGRVEDAHYLFDLMPHRNKSSAFPWNSLICGYVQLQLHEDALALYFQMEEDGVEPDRFTFPRALKACAGIGSLRHGEAVHRHAVRCGFATDAFVLNALVDMYAKCGDIMKARRVFDRIAGGDSVAYNSMITAYIRHRLVLEAVDTCRAMIVAGLEPDSVTVSALLPAISSLGKLALELHCWALRRGLEQNLSVSNSLIHLYSSRSQLRRATQVFDKMPDRDLVSWNVIIAAHRRDQRALSLFRRMQQEGPLPDKVTFVSLLSACASLRMVEEGKRLFGEMVGRYGIPAESVHYGCMVNMLGRAGMIGEAYEIVLERMRVDEGGGGDIGPSVWGALLHACSVYGEVEVGEIAAERLFEMEPDNEHNFELLMKIYRGCEREEGVERVKRLMRERGLECKC